MTRRRVRWRAVEVDSDFAGTERTFDCSTDHAGDESEDSGGSMPPLHAQKPSQELPNSGHPRGDRGIEDSETSCADHADAGTDVQGSSSEGVAADRGRAQATAVSIIGTALEQVVNRTVSDLIDMRALGCSHHECIKYCNFVRPPVGHWTASELDLAWKLIISAVDASYNVGAEQ